jgi:hypothetical protein
MARSVHRQSDVRSRNRFHIHHRGDGVHNHQSRGIDLAPGRDVDVSFVLPSGAPSTYLVVARVLPGAGHAPFAPTVFWLWSGPLPK